MRKDHCYIVGIESRKEEYIEMCHDGLLVSVYPTSLKEARKDLLRGFKIYKLVEVK